MFVEAAFGIRWPVTSSTATCGASSEASRYWRAAFDGSSIISRQKPAMYRENASSGYSPFTSGESDLMMRRASTAASSQRPSARWLIAVKACSSVRSNGVPRKFWVLSLTTQLAAFFDTL